MKRSNNKQKEMTAALYVRLSRDDNLEGDSYSIGNQKKLLTKIAKEKGYTNLLIFCDDGISGVTMERPGYKAMIEAIENNKISAVFVKDLSRLGRNYIEVGRLTEEFFPEYDIRLVAVSDNIDTQEGENELAPIKNLFNEWYARDISKKRRISNKIKGNAGEPLGLPPYGYIRNPDGKNWIVDEEAAKVAAVEEQTYQGNDGKITGVDTTMEYKSLSEPTFTWTQCAGTEITNLAPGSYIVRVAAVADESFASEVMSVTINAAAKDEPTEPTVNITYDDKNGNVNAIFTNITEEGMVYVAEYNENGTLLSIKSDEISDSVIIPFTCVNKSKVKVFIWKNDMKPLFNKVFTLN